MNIVNNNTYIKFEADMVLTSDHLNETFNYLEEQQRLTRAKLIGSGIVCGLDIHIQISGGVTAVVISKGTGLTSKGFLVVLDSDDPSDSISYPYFTPYQDPNEDIYSFFLNGTIQMPLYELQTQYVAGAESLANLDLPLTDYGVLLYLECFDKKLKNCIENDCNEKGTEVIFTLRKLLVTKTDLRNIICQEENLNVPKSELEIDNLVNARYHLSKLHIRRFRTGTIDITTSVQLINKYQDLINQSRILLYNKIQEQKSFLAQILKKDINVIQQLAEYLNDPTIVGGTFGPGNVFNLQYIYDFLCDSFKTYNELINAAFDLVSECCPALDRFPKHLRLGDLNLSSPCKPSAYRTGFTESPIHSHHHRQRAKVLSLFQKLGAVLTGFNSVQGFREVRIIPSAALSQPLSRQAIPYYYNVDANFLKNWNAGLKRKCRETENLSYHADTYNPKAVDHVLNPLEYGLDRYDFFRIEGHTGKEYSEALEIIQKKRKEYNLPFDVIALKLGKDTRGIDKKNISCHFKDLEIMCNAWKTELQCLLGKVINKITQVGIKDAIAVGQTVSTGTAVVEPHNTPGLEEVTGRQSEMTLGEEIRKTDFSTFTAVRTFDVETASLQARLAPKVFDDVVLNVETREDTLGGVLRIAMQQENEICKYDTVGIQEILKYEEVASLPLEDMLVAYQYPLELSVSLLEFAKLVDQGCNEIDLAALRKTLGELNKRASRYSSALKNYKSRSNSKVRIDYEGMMQIIMLLISNCTLKSLEVIRNEMDDRKDEILKMSLFHNYVKKNPGIDHKGGVPKGGTFILVYAGEEPEGQLKPPSSGKVVADFFLPYLCCSDCPPITYIFPEKEVTPEEEKVDLDITQKSFCTPDDKTYAFIVTPADGIVTGDGVGGNPGLGFFFAPSQIQPGFDFSRKITFQVNGKDVPLSVWVSKKPPVDFENVIEWRQVSGQRVSPYIDLTIPLYDSRYNYHWEILAFDGTSKRVIIDEVHPSNSGKVTFALTGLKEFTPLKISLKGSSKMCNDRHIIDAEIPKLEVSVEINFEVFLGERKLNPPYRFDNSRDDLVRILARPFGKFEVNSSFKTLGLEVLDKPADGLSSIYQFSPLKKPKGNYTLVYVTENQKRELLLTIEDKKIIDVLTNLASLASLNKDVNITGVLGANSIGVINTVNVANALQARMADPVMAKNVAEGGFNDNFVKTSIPAMVEVSKKVITANNPKAKNNNAKQNTMLDVYRKQLGLLLEMVIIQKEDLIKENVLSKMIATVSNQIKEMKKSGVKVDVGKKTQKVINDAAKKLSGKPKAEKRFKGLLKTVTG